MMSAPFSGAPDIPFDTLENGLGNGIKKDTIADELAALSRPRKHYQH